MPISTPHRTAAVASGAIAAAISHITGHPPPGVVVAVGVLVCGAYVAGLAVGDAVPPLIAHVRRIPRRRTALLTAASMALAIVSAMLAGESIPVRIAAALAGLFAPFLLDLAVAAHHRESASRTPDPGPASGAGLDPPGSGLGLSATDPGPSTPASGPEPTASGPAGTPVGGASA
ncbi:hypothetical protein ABZU32_20175 [Sphaerisporangium sp. NPDC005288]|uniref:hypothetical protein n=1 Tax=Sphaerisporangium sp. NPDC005288 TaxID=3155114 RepID=UPI0033B52974